MDFIDLDEFTIETSSSEANIQQLQNRYREEEAQRKERREQEEIILKLERSIKNEKKEIEQAENRLQVAVKASDKAHSDLILARCRNIAAKQVLEQQREELARMRQLEDEALSKVWNSRIEMCEAIRAFGEQYGLQALLAAPQATGRQTDILQIKKSLEEDLQDSAERARLLETIAKRDKALEENKRLSKEAASGEEFVRLRNALAYSKEKLAKLEKDKTEKKNWGSKIFFHD